MQKMHTFRILKFLDMKIRPNKIITILLRISHVIFKIKDEKYFILVEFNFQKYEDLKNYNFLEDFIIFDINYAT